MEIANKKAPQISDSLYIFYFLKTDIVIQKTPTGTKYFVKTPIIC